MSRSSGSGPIEWPADVVALFRDRRAEMVRLAHLITGSNPVAEEIVQEAFLRLREHWPTIDPSLDGHNPGGYLRTIVVNAARSHLRRVDVERRYAPALADRGTTTGDPELDETWAAVCRLSERQRAVLALRFYEDLSEVEIARILGCPVGTVKSSVRRGLLRLRRELS